MRKNKAHPENGEFGFRCSFGQGQIAYCATFDENYVVLCEFTAGMLPALFVLIQSASERASDATSECRNRMVDSFCKKPLEGWVLV